MLVDAAFELLGTEGWDGTTIRGVCQSARLNPRYFYESFDGLESLFLAVFDRLTSEACCYAGGPDHHRRRRRLRRPAPGASLRR